MQLEFSTKQMTTAMQAVKKMFDKGPFADADPGCQDCLVASVNEATAMLESAAGGLYTKATFPANVKEAGRVVINRSALHALKLSGERSSFQYKPGSHQLKFKSGQFSGELVVGEVFDEIEAARPAVIPELTLSLPSLTAKGAAKRICMASTLDAVLRMKLTVQHRQMTLSCNDSFRAAAVRANLDDEAVGDGEIEVPAVFFNTVLQSIEDTRVSVGFNSNVFRIAGGCFDICHPVMQEADRPMTDVFDRLDVFKQNDPIVIATIDTSMLRDSIKSVTSLAPVGTSSEVKVEFMFSERNGGQLTTALRSATSKGKFQIPLRSPRINHRVPVCVNAKYMIEMLNLIAADEIELYAWDRVVAIMSEKVGCCMFIPQLKSRDEE